MPQRPQKHPPKGTLASFGPRTQSIHLRANKRELATILAALRYYADENLQGTTRIPDRLARRTATGKSRWKALDFEEVGQLCKRLELAQPPSASRRGSRRRKHP